MGPKPARAYWVNQTGSDGRLTGRYAFWVEDESFRVNANYASDNGARLDNTADSSTGKYPLDPITHQPYIDRPADGRMAGIFATNYYSTYGLGSQNGDPVSMASSILTTRKSYPGSFFPEPLAFAQPASTPPATPRFTSTILDNLHYLTTTQSGTLNLTRHGTQRLNLNTTVGTVDLSQTTRATQTIQHQIDQIVQALKFHLPNFGQRFYRTDTGTTGSTLNATQVVYNSTLQSEGVGDPNLIYLYKVAANLRDYIDSDGQPTLVQAGGTVYPTGALPTPIQPFGDTEQPNPMWAVGKEATPLLQETVVRFRPVAPQGPPVGVKGTYTLAVDYYLEFWNPTDHDIIASNLYNPKIHISDQQTWVGYPSGSPLNLTKPDPVSPDNDFTIDLSGVVFRAGVATVITTDPDWKSYTYSSPTKTNTGGTASPIYKSDSGYPNPNTTFLCPILSPGTRTFTGTLPNQNTKTPDYGLYPVFRDPPPPGSTYQDYHTEVTFYNDYGYLDCQLFCLAEGGGSIWTTTDKYIGTPGGYNDYGYGGSLIGNSLVSEMGDPRTNNEQMMFHRMTGTTSGDLSRYFNGYHTLGYQNAEYVQPLGGPASNFSGTYATSGTTFYPWPDYYTWPSIHTDNVALSAQNAPAVIADRPLASIGQLGDVYDPARIAGSYNGVSTPDTARGGGRTFKIGQRDDRVTYDLTGTPSPNNTVNNMPASLGWAAWRLTDIFSAGPVDPSNAYGPTQELIELPARVNINGVTRDGGAALRTLLAGFTFQPATSVDSGGNVVEPLFHTPTSIATQALSTQPTDSTGVSKLVAQIATRLNAASPTTNTAGVNKPWGPFFERGEFGEIEGTNSAGKPAAIFGKNVTDSSTSTDLMGSSVDMNTTFDRGREEVFRRLAEMICTRGDTFTVYAVGQALNQATATSTPVITSTQRQRVTFRLVPKQFVSTQPNQWVDFHPAYSTSLTDGTISKGFDFNASAQQPNDVAARFARPDRYDIQVLEVNSY